jgi:hypothetical protein
MSEQKADAVGLAQWPYHAHRPQRFGPQYWRYLASGGTVRLEDDVRGFTSGGANVGDMARFYAFCLIQDQLGKEGLSGDLAELGAYKGHTATLLAATARRLNKTLYVFDTFEGFDERDLVGSDSSRKQQFSDTSLTAVRSLVGEDRVQYVKGYFPATVKAIPEGAEFCLVHVDCDLEAPVRSALEYFYPRLCPGGFMVIHDYSSMTWPTLEKAVDEFLASRPESLIPMPDGGGTAIFRKSKRPQPEDNWFLRRRADALRNGWTSGQSNALSQLLGEGWSLPEPWGIWGVGERHELNLYFVGSTECDLTLEVECRAALLGPRREQTIEVFVADDHATTWLFTEQVNRAVRLAPIKASLARGSSRLQIRFLPSSVASPHELDTTVRDTRKLGLGVLRMRLL